MGGADTSPYFCEFGGGVIGYFARRFYTTYSPRKAIILSALIFGIMHINPWQATNAFIGGIFYGWIYLRYKSIWLCMLMHAYNNILAFYFDLPYILVKNSGYIEIWRHPMWLNILGFFLFGFGLVTVIVLKAQYPMVKKATVAV